jgi:thymidylate kinase
MNTRYIELIGMSGAGKTTLLKVLKKKLEKSGKIVRLRESIFGDQNKELFKKISLIFKLISRMNFKFIWLFFISLRQETYQKYKTRRLVIKLVWRKLADTLAVYYLLEARKSDYLINDEGISKLVSLAVFGKVDFKRITHLIIESIPQDSVLIFLKVPPEVAKSRVDQRGSNKSIFKRDANLNKIISNKTASLYKRLEKEMRKENKLVVHSLNADQHIAEYDLGEIITILSK